MEMWKDYLTTWNEEHVKEGSSLPEAPQDSMTIYLNNNQKYPCTIDMYTLQSHNYCLLFKDYCSLFRVKIEDSISKNVIAPLETLWDYSYVYWYERRLSH